MRRSLRLGLIGAGGVLGVAVAAAVVFAATFDPDTQKDRIIDAVRRATGRELVLAGPLRLTWGWSPTLEAQDAALANRPGGSRPEMATVGRARAQVALWPLLLGRVEIGSVVLDRPDILLETDAQGIGNWQFSRPVAAGTTSEPAAPGHARAAVVLRRLVVENGRVTWRDGATGRTVAVDVPHATLSLGDGPARLVADGQSSGQALHLDAVVGQGDVSPWPVRLTLDAAGAHLALDGTVALPLTAGSFHGTADATVPDLAALGPLLQLPGLPPLHDIRFTLRPDGAATLHVGASPLDAVWPGMTLGQLDLTAPSVTEASGQVAAEGSFPDGPWRLASRVAAGPGSLALRGLQVTAPGSDVAGDVSVREGRVVQGSLVSQRLDADWLRRQAPAAPPPAALPGAPGPAPATPPPAARVFSDAPLPWERLRSGGANLDFTVATLHLGGRDYHGASGHLVLADGALRLDPFAVQAPGPIDGSLTLDASGVAALALHSPALSLAGLLGSDAPMEVDVDLHSAGPSPHALAAHLEGHAGLAMVDGAVDNAALLAAVHGVLPEAVSRQLDPAGRSSVRCLALRLDAHAGQVAVSALRLDTGRLDLDGGGGIDLAGETLALRLRPTVRVGGAAVLAPVRVEGSLAHPAAALDRTGVEGRSGLVIGGPGTPDDCGPALALARDGHAGRLPMTQAVKPPKPADLLRSFLR